MALSKKLIIGISMILAVALVAITVLVNFGVVANNRGLVSAILEQMEKDQQQSVRTLRDEFDDIAAELDKADAATRKIVLGLYVSSYNTLIRAVANQIFPMTEAFDFDSAGKVIEKLLANSKEVKYVKYTISKNPTPADIYEFGEKVAGDSQTFRYQMEGNFSYLAIEMQVSLAEMQAVGEIKDIFGKINDKNSELAEEIENRGEQSIAGAREYALSRAKTSERRLISGIGLIMLLVLAATIGVLIGFISRWVIKPINTTIAGLRVNSNRVADSSAEISEAGHSLAEDSAHQAAALEETSSSLEEMAAMTRQNAANAGEADRLS
ncbi:MAG: hypothetical protein P8Y63_10765, partial [Deltaproteobacteria bacterium]